MPWRTRSIVWLVATCSIAALDVALALGLGWVTLVSFIAARQIDTSEGRTALRWLRVAIGLDLLFLLGMGSLAPAIPNAAWVEGRGLFDTYAPRVEPLAAIGASFYSIQSIAYLLDVYRKRVDASPSLAEVTLLIGFLPKLASGPLVEPGPFLERLRARGSLWSAERLHAGFWLLTTGLFLKFAVANRLAAFNDPLFNAPAYFPGLALAVGAYLFAVQFMCEVAGYLRVARGLALLAGLELPEFRPTSPDPVITQTLWRGWFPSFTCWLEENVRRPLERRLGSVVSTVITFGLIGIWHRPRPAFLLAGVYFGCVTLVIARMRAGWARRLRGRRGAVERLGYGAVWVVGFHAAVLGLVLVRMESIPRAVEYFTVASRAAAHLVGNLGELGKGAGLVGPLPNVFIEGQMVFPICLLALGIVSRWSSRVGDLDRWAAARSRGVREALYVSTLIGIALFGRFGELPFFYFRF